MMKKYNIEIRETRVRILSVNADSFAEAQKAAMDKYANREVSLTEGDAVSTYFFYHEATGDAISPASC